MWHAGTSESSREFIQSTADQVGEMDQRMERSKRPKGQRTLMTIPGFGASMQEVQPAEAPAVFCHRLYHSLVSDRTDIGSMCGGIVGTTLSRD